MEKKLRHSHQRDMIYNYMLSTKEHPSAEMIYDELRKNEPNLSLGTLYRNLSQLEESGMVMRIPDGANDRFDGNAKPHVHFKCTSCGKVYDLMSFKNDSITFSDDIIGEVTNYSLMAFGSCKHCNKLN